MDGVLFGDKHSYRDWYLILKERPKINPPEVKTVHVDIPGADGSIDLSESLTGEVHFKNRTIKCKFWIIEGKNKWAERYSVIMEYLQGRNTKIIFDDDLAYYYIGRLRVSDWKIEKGAPVVTIEGDAEPYKYELFSSLEEWEWDSFDFENGIIREYKDMRVDENLVFEFEGRRKTITPTFIVTSDDGNGLKVQFEGTTYDLPDGSSRVLNIKIKSGINTLEFTGNGTVSVDYRGGRL